MRSRVARSSSETVRERRERSALSHLNAPGFFTDGPLAASVVVPALSDLAQPVPGQSTSSSGHSVAQRNEGAIAHGGYFP